MKFSSESEEIMGLILADEITDVSFYTVGNIQLGSLSNILDAVIKNRDANKNKRILRLTVRRLQAASVF